MRPPSRRSSENCGPRSPRHRSSTESLGFGIGARPALSPSADIAAGRPAGALHSLHGASRSAYFDVIWFMDRVRPGTLAYHNHWQVTMSTAPMNINHSMLLRTGAAAALAAATSLAGCVVAAPPPRYYDPAPAAYSEPQPADDVEVQASEAPPPLPDYAQPPCPQDGYIWTPGYWGWGGGGYYWVPGTWVQPPSVGVLWTPGYWAFGGGVYAFHAGYWGPQVGFYGGVNYGYGYGGRG